MMPRGRARRPLYLLHSGRGIFVDLLVHYIDVGVLIVLLSSLYQSNDDDNDDDDDRQ